MFLINLDKCTGCGNCIDICPVQAISMQDEQAVINSDKCAGCGVCVDECPNDAIYKRELESEVKEIAVGGGTNDNPRGEKILGQSTLATKSDLRQAKPTCYQGAALDIARNRLRGVGSERGCCNRRGWRG